MSRSSPANRREPARPGNWGRSVADADTDLPQIAG
jgi:hypothetical protein